MSDTSQGPGWWRASDGRWYPPETHPQYKSPPAPKAPPGPIAPFLPERPSVARRLWDGYRRWPRGGQIGAVVGFVVLVLVALATLANNDKQPVASNGPAVASTSTTAVPATTSTTVVLPAGTDTTVASITDGDSFKTADGTAVRMTGIDAPDTGACLATEATAHLTELIPVGTPIRLVHDSRRTDASDRDLAYVYRLSDGAFVNLAMARDGFAYELKVAPNLLHAEELAAAVTAAQTAKVGVWASCSTSTAGKSATGSSGSTTTRQPASTTTTSAYG